MKTISISKGLLIISLIYLLNCDLTILGPRDLAKKLNDKEIEMKFASIGPITHSFYSRGQLFLDVLNFNQDACRSVNQLLSKQKDETENVKILLVKSGGCSIETKARNAQHAGFALLIIVSKELFLKDRIVINENSGKDIHILVSVISQDDGKKIIDYINKEANKEKKIVVEIDYNRKETYKVDFKFFFSSSELKAYELMNNMTQYLDKFGDQVEFTPIYVVHQDPFYDPKNPHTTKNCVSNGKYCYFPKNTTITQDGKEILKEDLRQKCMFMLSKKKNMGYYYDYLKAFYLKCLNIKRPKFDGRCSKISIDYLGFPVNDVSNCVINSFNGPYPYENDRYFENENDIFNSEYNQILDNKLTTFPAVMINNKLLEGTIKETNIVSEICNLVKTKPDFCLFMTGEVSQHNNMINQRKYVIYFLIVLLILINIFIFLICRKYIIKRINERIDQGNIDIEGRIKNVIGNYFSLKRLDSDYSRMTDNSSSSFPFNSSSSYKPSGPVVDIAVETV